MAAQKFKCKILISYFTFKIANFLSFGFKLWKRRLWVFMNEIYIAHIFAFNELENHITKASMTLRDYILRKPSRKLITEFQQKMKSHLLFVKQQSMKKPNHVHHCFWTIPNCPPPTWHADQNFGPPVVNINRTCNEKTDMILVWLQWL